LSREHKFISGILSSLQNAGGDFKIQTVEVIKLFQIIGFSSKIMSREKNFFTSCPTKQCPHNTRGIGKGIQFVYVLEQE